MGLASGAFSAYALLCVHLQPTRLRRGAASEPGVLSASEFAVLSAVADRICPDLGPGNPGALALGGPEMLTKLIASSSAGLVKQLKQALAVLESPVVGLLTGERIRPFTQLAPAEQDAVLHSFRYSSLPPKRAIYRALRNMVAGYYYGDPRVWHVSGYGGPPQRDLLRAAYRDQLVDYSPLQGEG